MPNFGTWTWLSWSACIVGEIFVACVLRHISLRRKYPAIFGYVCTRSAISLILLGIKLTGDGADWGNFAYFYVYYFGVIASCVYGYYIVVNITASLVDSAEMRYVIKTAWRYICGAFLVGSGLFSFLSPLPFDEWIVARCHELTRAVSLACIASFLLTMLMVRWLRVSWPPRLKGMAAGYAILSMGDVLVTWLGGTLLDMHSPVLGYVADVPYLACLATWIYTLRSAVRPIPLPRLSAVPTLEKV